MLLYDFLFLILFILFTPILALRGKLYRGYIERLGFISKLKKSDKSIWVHAVSVGEILSTKELIRGLKKEFKGCQILITTITATGNKIAKQISQDDDLVTYLPLDIGFIIKKFIKRFNPKIFIALETEIWPNLIIQLSKAAIPMVIVNGRISDKSFKKYRAFGRFLNPVLKRIDCFAMQSKIYSERILFLGARPQTVVVSGNMKFDAGINDEKKEDPERLRKELKLGDDIKLLVAGCTHRREEEMILKVYKRLSSGSRDVRLLIAPRHIERLKEVESKIIMFGFKPARVSKLANSVIDEKTVYLLDEMGVLKDYYAACFCAFVGGSLVPFGGHNILEPAFFAKPIIFGKFMHNFSDIRDLFLHNTAALEVKDLAEFEDRLRQIIENNPFAVSLGQKARGLVMDNRGATERNIQIIKKFLKPS